MELGLNEAAVQYISSKIIGIKPDFEKYYDLNLFTPSPSYYPVECALLNELIFFVGENLLFKSTFYSTDDFKKEIVNRTSKTFFNQIQQAFDYILKYEEKIINLKNSNSDTSFESEISDLRLKIKFTFINAQDLIIKNFFNYDFYKISNLEELDIFRKNLTKFKKYIAVYDGYTFFDNYYLETMNKLEHKSNILENGDIETALDKKNNTIINVFQKFLSFFKSKHIYLKK